MTHRSFVSYHTDFWHRLESNWAGSWWVAEWVPGAAAYDAPVRSKSWAKQRTSPFAPGTREHERYDRCAMTVCNYIALLANRGILLPCEDGTITTFKGVDEEGLATYHNPRGFC